MNIEQVTDLFIITVFCCITTLSFYGLAVLTFVL